MKKQEAFEESHTDVFPFPAQIEQPRVGRHLFFLCKILYSSRNTDLTMRKDIGACSDALYENEAEHND